MKLITTADKSTSIYNPKIREGYHSSSGAMTESIEKFCKPLKEYISKKDIKVLDTCFGIGYRSAAFVHVFRDSYIDITAIEIDPDLLEIMQFVQVPKEVQPAYKLFKKLKKDSLKFNSDRVSCSLNLGDCVSIVPSLKKKFDVVLHDPFSPKKVPELWTQEFFQDIYNKMNPGAVLSTYSSSGVVRDRLRKIGFAVKNGPSIGRRSPSTIAIKQTTTN